MDQITQEQAQELMDTIVAKCEELELSTDAILDGLGRVMLSATNAFDKKKAIINVDGVGVCEVTMEDNAGSE